MTHTRDIGSKRARSVRRAAKVDARHGVPQPRSDGVVTTPYRAAVWARRDAAVGRVREALDAEVLPHERTRQRAHETLVDLELRATQARKRIDELRAQVPDLTRRGPGDRALDADAVAVRRRRDHERAVRQLEGDLDAIEDRAAAVRVEAADATACSTAAERRAAHVASRIHDEHRAERDLYDGVLLRRHPRRRVLAACLDPTLAPLPHWVERALGTATEEAPS